VPALYNPLMKYNPDIRKRKSLRLKEYDYSGQGMYFVTICVKNRECLFGNIANNKIILSVPGKIAHDCLTEITTHFRDIMLDNYVIMPNHVHAIIMIKTGNDQHRRGLINQTPTNQTPTNQTPTNQTPTNQTPTNQTPTSQIPTSQIPVATQWIMMKNPNQTLGKIIRYFKGKSSFVNSYFISVIILSL